MATHFERQLEELHVQIITMGSLCEKVISLSNRAIRGDDCVREIFDTDREIDTKEREIENHCMRILLHQQPVAKDLREVSAALKMISDMERIGDQASDIAEICSFLQGWETESRLHIRDMAEATMKMVTESIDSFVKKDLNIAKEVILYDDVVDELFGKVKQELIGLLTREDRNEELGEFCIDMLMIAKYFERIGDHATNIAEWVEYSITGTHLE